MNPMENSIISLSVEEQYLREIDNRVFARMCQLIDTYGEKNIAGAFLKIPFERYDEIDASMAEVNLSDVFDCDLGRSIKSKLRVCGIIEAFTDEEVTSFEDFEGGIINAFMCRDKHITSGEIDGKVVFNLV